MPPSPSLTRILERFGPLAALLLLIAGTAIIEAMNVPAEDRRFLTLANFNNILGQNSFVGIVAIGMTFVILIGGIDLSVGAMVALVGGAAILAMNRVAGAQGDEQRVALGIAAAVAVCIGGGILAGTVNGLLVAKGRIAAFVATLGTMAIFRSLIVAQVQGAEIRSAVPDYRGIGSATISLPGLGLEGHDLPLRVSILVFLALAAVAHIVLSRTVFGRRVYALGDNAMAARYAGVPIVSTTISVYAIAGLCCGVAALLVSSRANSVASSSTGMLYELDAIAAVVIGGTRLQGGAGRVWGTVVGVLILGVINNMLNMLDVNVYYQGLLKGLIILAAVLAQPKKPA
ncbi:MAG: ABC transporter permease [Phycisphaeraceae bacterium]|nr:ABC transporter permease [Phycisphaeraceae bacterium]